MLPLGSGGITDIVAAGDLSAVYVSAGGKIYVIDGLTLKLFDYQQAAGMGDGLDYFRPCLVYGFFCFFHLLISAIYLAI